MTDRVVVFLDWQNVYNRARDYFCLPGADHWEGQVDPVKLAQHLADDSQYDRALHQVRIYRGRPDQSRDPTGYAACLRQIGVWQQSPLVEVVTRTLRYPAGWPAVHAQEKGIDVALAVDFAVMAVRREYEVGIMMSTDTDLKPALEYVAGLMRAWGSPRAEVAAYSTTTGHSRRLSIPPPNLYCHWVGKAVYDKIADPTIYSQPLS